MKRRLSIRFSTYEERGFKLPRKRTPNKPLETAAPNEIRHRSVGFATG